MIDRVLLSIRSHTCWHARQDAVFTRRNKSREGECLQLLPDACARARHGGNKESRRDSLTSRTRARASNYLSLSRPQTQLVQRAQWAQYPVEGIAMRDRRLCVWRTP